MTARGATQLQMPGLGEGLPTMEGVRPMGLDREKRAVVIRHALAAMDEMGLDDASKLALLGLSPRARSTLHRYRTGASVPEATDQLERCANILRIATALKHLFPEGARYWLDSKPSGFAGRSVGAMMLESFEGLTRTRRLIEGELQR